MRILTLEEALLLSGTNSVEWKLYTGLHGEVTISMLEKRIAYLESSLMSNHSNYRNVVLPFLREQFYKRKQEAGLLIN
jgi:hypothetical protein